MIVTYNKDFLEDESALGASLYYPEILRLINSLKDDEIEFVPHSFREIVLGQANLPKLEDGDVLLSNMGPYVWYYHYLREKNNLNFNIFRDVQTSFGLGYFLQEDLCQHFTREGDSIIFPSNFNRILFMKFFPNSITEKNSHIFNTFGLFFPKVERIENGELTLGFLGRVTRDKNFDQALEVFVKVSKILGKNVRMLVQGTLSYDKEIFSQEKVRQSLVKEGVNPENYQHVFNGQIVNYESIWDTLRKIDVLLFPSVSSVESFGRVLVEAGHAGCTVISSNHAAAPEILESNNLVDVEFSRKMFDLRNVSSLGRIDVDEMVDKCCNHEKLSKKFNNNYSNAENFLKILKNSPISVPNKICKKIEEFIKNVRITRSPRNDKHDDLIKKLCENLVLDAKNNEIRISAFPSIQTKYSIYCSLL